MLYHLLKEDFNFNAYLTLEPTSNTREEQNLISEVKEINDALLEHKIKLAAAYARIRISRQATGSTSLEQLENCLPPEVRFKESVSCIFY